MVIVLPPAGFARWVQDAFAEPQRVGALMRGFEPPWFVAGGWAVDLLVGRATREHEDIEIAVLRRDQQALRRHLAGWTFAKVVEHVREPWREGEDLALPVHELHATRGGEALEILLEESEADRWRFRRNLTITLPLAAIGRRSLDGLPYLAPEIVLLYKAKEPRPRDEHDLDVAVPWMEEAGRAWLRTALQACHPGHPWTTRL